MQGQRVNMAEVERAVLQGSDVDKVVILHHVLSDIASVLVAYFTTTSERDVIQVENDIAQRCVTSLPVCMRPKLVHLDEIPLQSHTGKTDRLALKPLYVRMLKAKSMEEFDSLNEIKKKVTL